MFIKFFKNAEPHAVIPANDLETVRVSSHGSIIASDFQGCYNIESYSCINRSSVDKYGGLGLHSYISILVLEDRLLLDPEFQLVDSSIPQIGYPSAPSSGDNQFSIGV